MGSADDLSHFDTAGRASMVDVGDKPVTDRTAVAEGFVRISPALEAAINARAVAKGNLLEVARVAGIQAAKRTGDLIPLCHPLPLDVVEVDASLQPGRIRITARVRAHGRTGIEMEALTAVAVAALTVIDMGKAIDRAMTIEGIRVLEKHGGQRGPYTAAPADSTSQASPRTEPGP